MNMMASLGENIEDVELIIKIIGNVGGNDAK